MGTQPPPQKKGGGGHATNFRPMSIVTNRSPISATAELLLSHDVVVELRFYVPLDTKFVVSETFSRPISWRSNEETKPKATKANNQEKWQNTESKPKCKENLNQRSTLKLGISSRGTGRATRPVPRHE